MAKRTERSDTSVAKRIERSHSEAMKSGLRKVRVQILASSKLELVFPSGAFPTKYSEITFFSNYLINIENLRQSKEAVMLSFNSPKRVFLTSRTNSV